MTWIKSLVVSIFCAGAIWADHDPDHEPDLICIWGMEEVHEFVLDEGTVILKAGEYFEFRSDGIVVYNRITTSNIPLDEATKDGFATTYSVAGDSLFIDARIWFNNDLDPEVVRMGDYDCYGIEDMDMCWGQGFKPSAYLFKVDSALGRLAFYDMYMSGQWTPPYSKWSDGHDTAMIDALIFPAAVKERLGAPTAVATQTWGEVKRLHHILP